MRLAGWRAEVVLGLLRLARAFDRLNRERGLPEPLVKSTFRRLAALTAAAYPDSPRWAEHGLVDTLELPERPQRWLLEAIPPLAKAVRHEKAKAAHQHRAPCRFIAPDPSWTQSARDLAATFRSGRLESLPEAERLLQGQTCYAQATGDTYNIVRSLTSFASRIQRLRPLMANRWAEEALVWEPQNPFCWTTITNVLLRQRKLDGALCYGWASWKRFPDNVVARNGLADTLRRARRWDDAESEYRHSIELGYVDQATLVRLAYLVLRKGDAGRGARGAAEGRCRTHVEAEPALIKAAGDEPTGGTPAARTDPLVVAALVAEAYFHRTWARVADGETALTQRRKAAELLAQATQLEPADPQVVAEQTALAMAEGNEREAGQRRAQTLGSQPAAAPLLVLKARLDRQAARREHRPLNETTLADLCQAPQRLRDLNPALTPLYHWQRGLAALALVDGANRVNAAADAFAHFRRTLSR